MTSPDQTNAEFVERLREEVSMLDSFLLTSITTEPPDPLTRSDQIGVRAFIVLGHAAIEEFVEAAFVHHLRRSCAVDGQGRVSSAAYLALLQVADDVAGQLKKGDRSPAEVLARLPGLYETKVINSNHGIRRKHLMNMALGAGLGWPEMENACEAFIAHCDTLGSKRGQYAHVSSTSETPAGGVSEVMYPSNARGYASDVIATLPAFLTYLATLRYEGVPEADVSHPVHRISYSLRSIARRTAAARQAWRDS